jgi:hypothetical protein
MEPGGRPDIDHGDGAMDDETSPNAGDRRTFRFAPPNKVIAVVVLAMAAGMIPWIIFLALTLPPRYDAGHWRLLWVGYDVAEVAVLAYMAWAAWFRREILAATALVIAVLMFCDAWFDIVTSFGHGDQWVTLATGFGVEIPIGLFFFWLYRRIVMRSLVAYHQAAHDGQLPRNLHTARMVFDAGDGPRRRDGWGRTGEKGDHRQQPREIDVKRRPDP